MFTVVWSSATESSSGNGCSMYINNQFLRGSRLVWRSICNHYLTYVTRCTVNVTRSVVPMADHVRLLGVTLDNRLSMDKHVNEVSQTCFNHLRALQHIRPAATVSDANMIACSVVDSQLDYANACCMEHHPRTLIVFNASKMRWLDASWTQKLIGAWMRCYINYTGCLSVIVLTLNLLNSRSSLVHLPLARTLVH